MTVAQEATLRRLAQAAYELEAFKPNLTRTEADKRIAVLTAKLKLLDGRRIHFETRATGELAAKFLVVLRRGEFGALTQRQWTSVIEAWAAIASQRAKPMRARLVSLFPLCEPTSCVRAPITALIRSRGNPPRHPRQNAARRDAGV